MHAADPEFACPQLHQRGRRSKGSGSEVAFDPDYKDMRRKNCSRTGDQEATKDAGREMGRADGRRASISFLFTKFL